MWSRRDQVWETRFTELLGKMQSLVVASLTLTAESASASPEGHGPDTNAPVLQYLAHCFSLVRLECEVPKPPRPANTYGGLPGFVWTGDDAPYSGRLEFSSSSSSSSSSSGGSKNSSKNSIQAILQSDSARTAV